MGNLLSRLVSALACREVLWGVVGLGIVLRVVAAVTTVVGYDGAMYLAMGRAFADHGEFWLPFGDPWASPEAPAFSHHYSPLWPMLLGSSFAAFGGSVLVAKVLSLLTGVGLLAVAYVATRDLYGRSTALAVTACLSVYPEFILDVGRLYSENLTMMLFVATIWAILRSLKDPRFMIAAGLFAGLAFLSRGALGYFFVLAGVAGLGWRLRYVGLRVFRDKSYLAGIGVFAVSVGLWSSRNLLRFGFPNWETSVYVSREVSSAFGEPGAYLGQVLLMGLFLTLLLLAVALAFLPEFLRSLRAIRREEESGLWLAVVLIPFLAAFIVAALALVENTGWAPLFWRDRIRYVVYALFPLLLIPLRGILILPWKMRGAVVDSVLWRFSRRRFLAAGVVGGCVVASLLTTGPWLVPLFAAATVGVFLRPLKPRLLLLVLALLLVSAETATSSTWSAEESAVNFIASQHPGAVVAVEGQHGLFYEVAVYSEERGLHLIEVEALKQADFILTSNESANFPGFHRVAMFQDGASQGILEGTIARILHRPTVALTNPLFVHAR